MLFRSHGFEGATTEKIARAAGVNEVTLFRRYGSKARLFDRVIQHELADTPLTSVAFSGDLEADLLAIVKYGSMTQAEAEASMRALSREVMPALRAG